MPVSAELSRLPGIAASFYRAGLMREMVVAMLRGETGRDLIEDARKILSEMEKESKIEITGLENMPESGAVIVFNHPNNNLIIPAILDLSVKVFDRTKQRIKLTIASEITMLSNKLNEKVALPGSPTLLNRVYGLYPDQIIPIPTAENRKDYLTGRAIAIRKILRSFKDRNLIAISPEGHIEKGGCISPTETFHEGSGKIAILATKMGIPTVPMAIWEEEKKIQVIIGQPFYITAQESDLAAVEAMFEVSKYLPPDLRGPFK